MARKKMIEPFTFADLFAGIGGMRFAFEGAGGVCVLTSEIDSAARATYNLQTWASSSPDHVSVDDVVALGEMQKNKIPKFDVLVAGFPCQPYSIAGLRQGLNDEKGRGQVFLSIVEILNKVRPKAFLLENVRGMLSHDNGETINFMTDELQYLGYKKPIYKLMKPKVLNSMTHGGVPHNRERVFIVGFRTDIDPTSFSWPLEIPLEKDLRSILEKSGVPKKYYYTAAKYDCYSQIKKSIRSKNTAYQWRRTYVRENKSGVCPALTANMGSGGHNVPLVLVKDGIRKLTPLECARLQGLDKYNFKIPLNLSDSRLYHQIGNSVTVPLIEKIAERIAVCLTNKN